MSTDIKPGDLVMVVRPTPCCGYSGSLGLVRTVLNFQTQYQISNCAHCGEYDFDFCDGRYSCIGGENEYILNSRLKKINPLAIDEGIESERLLEAV